MGCERDMNASPASPREGRRPRGGTRLRPGPSIFHSLFTVLGNINVSVDTAASGTGSPGGRPGRTRRILLRHSCSSHPLTLDTQDMKVNEPLFIGSVKHGSLRKCNDIVFYFIHFFTGM